MDGRLQIHLIICAEHMEKICGEYDYLKLLKLQKREECFGVIAGDWIAENVEFSCFRIFLLQKFIK